MYLSSHLPAESREHNFVLKSWATTAAPIVFSPSLPSATQHLSGTQRTAAPQHCRTNAPLSTASVAASALPAKPSSQPRNLHCCALVGLRHSHDHQAKRTQVLLDQEETDQAPHIFIHDQESTKTTSQRQKEGQELLTTSINSISIIPVHRTTICSNWQLCSPIHTQDRGSPTFHGENPTRSNPMPDNNSQTLLDCWSKAGHSMWNFFGTPGQLESFLTSGSPRSRHARCMEAKILLVKSTDPVADGKHTETTLVNTRTTQNHNRLPNSCNVC